MFDRPGLVLLVTVVTLAPLAAHVMVKAVNSWRNPTGADAVLSFLTLLAADSFIGMIVSAYLAHLYDEYKRMVADDDRPKLKPVEPVEVKRTLLDMNMVSDHKPVYAFQTPLVKIDHMSRKVKHFCIVLVNQRDQGFKIDLKEGTWSGHFDGRDNYVWVRDVKMAGAFAKEFPRVNSPFTVIDWRIVERGAEGRL